MHDLTSLPRRSLVHQTRFSQPLWEDPEEEAKVAEQTLLGRLGEPHEIAGAVAFLASELVTGLYMSDSKMHYAE